MTAFATYPSLRDRTVLITGGATGIGRTMVEHFAQQGSRVAFLDLDATSGEDLVDSLAASAPHPPLFLRCDLTDISQLRTAVDALQSRLGALAVLVNNAANDDRHAVAEVTPEYWDDRMAVNLRHQFFVIQAVLPGMAEAGGGSIVNMSSIAWMIGATGFPAYATAKAGIVGLTRAMARECGERNIRVNCVLPGAILTERQKRLWMTPEYSAEILSRQTLKRHLEPEDVARLVLFLAAEDSGAITGQSYIVDGGFA